MSVHDLESDNLLKVLQDNFQNGTPLEKVAMAKDSPVLVHTFPFAIWTSPLPPLSCIFNPTLMVVSLLPPALL